MKKRALLALGLSVTLMFSNIATAVFTYFFTRKTNVEKNTENETTNDINQD